MADDDTQGTGHYPGPDHSFLSDALDWNTAHELGPRAIRRPRLLPAHRAGQLFELARAARLTHPAPQ